MKLKKALRYLDRTHKIGLKLGLENMNRLLERMGHPENNLKIIHVAGTNGKGSTCSMIYHMLMEAGYQTGFYSSPHLLHYNERFQWQGQMISDEELSEGIDRMKKWANQMVAEGYPHPTEFELLTALAFDFFSRSGCEWMVSEVGLGGRLDATNVIKAPRISVITPIALDHQFFLGETPEEIAKEKGGIIKESVPVVVAEQSQEVLNILSELAHIKKSPFYRVDPSQRRILSSSLSGSDFSFRGEDYHLKLIGEYQIQNAQTALLTLEVLKNLGEITAPFETLKAGLEKTRWMGRIEKIGSMPDFYVDGSHNPHGARTLRSTFSKICSEKRCLGIVGMKEDKDLAGVLAETADLFSEMILTLPTGVQGIPLERFEELLPEKKIHRREDLKEAVKLAYDLAEPEDLILCYGSFYLIGDVRAEVLKEDE